MMRLLCIACLVYGTHGFIGPRLHQWNSLTPSFSTTSMSPVVGLERNRSSLKYKSDDGEEEEDCADKDDEEKMDWREFRARLVSTYDVPDNEKKQVQKKLDDHSWMYETGSTIEIGSVLLHKIDHSSDDSGYGLARQYLHKSVVLILEHDNVGTTMSTKGVILNRPTDLILHEPTTENLEEVNFPIWFGGSQWGLSEENPKFFCLHSIKSVAAQRVSKKVMKGIYFSSVSAAKTLIADGVAKADDFFFYGGYLEWENGELFQEIEDGLWHTISTDASTVKKGLKILTEQNIEDVANAGTKTWAMMMDLMHQNSNSTTTLLEQDSDEAFDDKMLHEWATQNLFFKEEPLFLRDDDDDDDDGENDIGQEIAAVSGKVLPGTLIRGSSTCSSFLFSEQEFHKSLVLIIQDDQELSVGLILNQPSSKTFEISLKDDSNFFKSTFSMQLPIRYGGSYGSPTILNESEDYDDSPLFILHNSETLRDANIGHPIGEHFKDGIWSCTPEQYTYAIANYMASPDQFMCVDGFCLWTKEVSESGNVVGGVMDDVLKGNFEVVPHVCMNKVWDELLKQQVLCEETLEHNFNIFRLAWDLADIDMRGDRKKDPASFSDGNDQLALLSDEALKRWMRIYLYDD